VSVAIMAHPRRSGFIPELQAALDRPATVAWDDGSNSRWGTGRRALLAYDPAASHHLVLQDDSVIPRDLVAGLEAALQHAPEDVPVCLYVGKVRPYREMVTEYVRRARDASWLVMDRINWGVALVFPTSIIDELVAYCDTQTIPNYDSRMSKWFEAKRIPVWYPFPSLVDHRESPSLVPGRGHSGRVAHRFIGADASALDIDYSGQVLRLPNANDYRPGGQTNMLFYCDIPNYSIPTIGARFVNHYFEATLSGQIAYLQRPFMARRGVRLATEEETAAWYGTEVKEPAPTEVPAETVEVAEPAPVVAPAETVPVEESVPDGTADEIMAWVGTDTERALAAIEAEEAREKPRKTLLSKLEAL
jgi:hypothetical protein